MVEASPSGRPLAVGRPSAKKQSIAQILLSLGFVGAKVFGGYVALLAILTAVHFPYQVDPRGAPKGRKDAGSFYQKIYSAKQSAPATAADVESPAAPDSKYVKMAREAIENERILPKITAFAKDYRLSEGKRVLDVGAETGYLQDIVQDYTGLDISPSARRYFHKPFVEASATDMPFPDNEFDAAWSVWVLEHVPKPEQALSEIRRVVKNGGLLYLKPAWDCPWWFADGYEVRSYGDLSFTGKVKKASLNVLASPYYRGASLMPSRFLRQAQARWSGKPTQFHYRLLEPNYQQYWVADSDAVNGLDYFEMLLWFTSRGDECLNCGAEPIWDVSELILRIHK